MYVFGINVPILELLVILCTVVVIYLIILEIEFRHLRKTARKFDEDEIKLAKEVRELGKIIVSIKGSKTKRKK